MQSAIILQIYPVYLQILSIFLHILNSNFDSVKTELNTDGIEKNIALSATYTSQSYAKYIKKNNTIKLSLYLILSNSEYGTSYSSVITLPTGHRPRYGIYVPLMDASGSLMMGYIGDDGILKIKCGAGISKSNSALGIFSFDCGK